MQCERFSYLILQEIVREGMYHRRWAVGVFVYHVDTISGTVCIIVTVVVAVTVRGPASGGFAVIVCVVVIVTVCANIIVRTIGTIAIGTIHTGRTISAESANKVAAKVPFFLHMLVRWQFTIHAVIGFWYKISIIYWEIGSQPYRFRVEMSIGYRKQIGVGEFSLRLFRRIGCMQIQIAFLIGWVGQITLIWCPKHWR